jgi:hypothetical protein
MYRPDGGWMTETRALECTLASVAALLAAESIREALEPLRRAIGLLLGT